MYLNFLSRRFVVSPYLPPPLSTTAEDISFLAQPCPFVTTTACPICPRCNPCASGYFYYDQTKYCYKVYKVEKCGSKFRNEKILKLPLSVTGFSFCLF